MTASHASSGTPTSATGSATAPAPAYPGTVNPGQRATMFVNLKPFSATCATPSDWTQTGTGTNGSTASGTNTGSVKWYTFEHDCDGTEDGTTVTLSVTGADSAGAVIHTADRSLGAWDTTVVATGNKVGNSANMSATTGTQTSVAAGDLVYEFFAMNASLGTPSADTLTQTGVTFGTVTNRSDRAITTGNDSRNRVNSVPVTSVTTPSGGATGGYTNSSSTSGALVTVRLRDVAGGTTPVTATRATTWDVLAVVSDTRATTWDTLATVSATRATTWDVAVSVTAARATTWDVLAAVASTRATTWDTLARVTGTRATTYDVRITVTAQRSTTWNVDSTLVAVTATRATTWRVLARATGARATEWDTRALVASTRTGSWDTLATVAGSRATTWRTLAVVQAVRAALWRVLAAVSASRATEWAVEADALPPVHIAAVTTDPPLHVAYADPPTLVAVADPPLYTATAAPATLISEDT